MEGRPSATRPSTGTSTGRRAARTASTATCRRPGGGAAPATAASRAPPRSRASAGSRTGRPTAFLPVYVQGVMGRSALVAGFAMTAMVLGWPVGATLAARNFARLGLRPTLLLGAALLPAGALVFVALGPDSPPVAAGLGSVVTGFGMGFLSTAAIVIVQGSVGWAERGVATASNIFSRNLGSALGAAVLGSVLDLGLAHEGAAAVGPDQVRRLLDQPGGATTAGDAVVRAVLHQALHLTFWAVLLLTVLTLLLALLVPPVEAAGHGAREAAAAD